MRSGIRSFMTAFSAVFGKAFGNSTAASPGDSSRERSRQNITIFAIVLAGLAIRLIYFSGDGLGDDPNYFNAFKLIYDGHLFNTQYHHRFSYWLPQVIIWKLFGISEFTFILPVLLSSLGCIYVVFLITRELFGADTAFIAAALMAVNPFEVLNATLISTDVNLSLYMLLSVYFFIRGQQIYGAWPFFLSGLFVMFAFVNKPFGLFVLPMLGIFYLRQEGFRIAPVLKYRSFMVSLAAVFLVLFGFFWKWTGDPLMILNIYKDGREPFNPFRMDLNLLMIYPKLLFFKHEFGERLNGYHFVAVLLAVLLIRKRNFKDVFPVLAWFLAALALLNFMPHKIIDGVPYSAQRIFRYFVFVVPPSVIFLSYFWGRLKSKNSLVFAIGFSVYMALSLYWCSLSTLESRVAFGETREAIKVLREFRDVHIYSDGFFISKIQRLENGRNFNKTKLHPWVYVETPEAWKQKFLTVQEGYVVTGGPRMPYHGCYPCLPNLGDFVIPENWILVREFSPKLYPPWKVETLRIWRVDRERSAHPTAPVKTPMKAPKAVLSSKVLTESESGKLYESGMQYFDKNDCKSAQSYYGKIVSSPSDTEHSLDALYFHSICFFRMQDWKAAIDHFTLLVDRYPKSNWVAGAHFHMGSAYKELGDYENAKKEFQYVIKHFPNDKPQVAASREQLKSLPGYSEDGFFRNLFR